MGRTAELGQIAGAGDPVAAARVLMTREAVKAARSQILTERKQRRQIKIHRYAMDKERREIGWSLRRREKCAMQADSVSAVLNVQISAGKFIGEGCRRKLSHKRVRS